MEILQQFLEHTTPDAATEVPTQQCIYCTSCTSTIKHLLGTFPSLVRARRVLFSLVSRSLLMSFDLLEAVTIPVSHAELDCQVWPVGLSIVRYRTDKRAGLAGLGWTPTLNSSSALLSFPSFRPSPAISPPVNPVVTRHPSPVARHPSPVNPRSLDAGSPCHFQSCSPTTRSGVYAQISRLVLISLLDRVPPCSRHGGWSLSRPPPCSRENSRNCASGPAGAIRGRLPGDLVPLSGHPRSSAIRRASRRQKAGLAGAWLVLFSTFRLTSPSYQASLAMPLFQ